MVGRRPQILNQVAPVADRETAESFFPKAVRISRNVFDVSVARLDGVDRSELEGPLPISISFL